MHLLGQRIGRDLDDVLERKLLNSGDVVLRWSSAAAPADPNVEGEMDPSQDQQMTVTALIHFVNAKSVPNGFMVFDKLDAIVTFDSSLNLDAMEGLTYALPDGHVYVPADTGGKAVEFWETVICGERLARTVALRKL